MTEQEIAALLERLDSGARLTHDEMAGALRLIRGLHAAARAKDTDSAALALAVIRRLGIEEGSMVLTDAIASRSAVAALRERATTIYKLMET